MSKPAAFNSFLFPPLSSPQEWPEKIRFTGPDQPSPRWSHGNAKVWPGAQSNLSSF